MVPVEAADMKGVLGVDRQGRDPETIEVPGVSAHEGVSLGQLAESLLGGDLEGSAAETMSWFQQPPMADPG